MININCKRRQIKIITNIYNLEKLIWNIKSATLSEPLWGKIKFQYGMI